MRQFLFLIIWILSASTAPGQNSLSCGDILRNADASLETKDSDSILTAALDLNLIEERCKATDQKRFEKIRSSIDFFIEFKSLEDEILSLAKNRMMEKFGSLEAKINGLIEESKNTALELDEKNEREKQLNDLKIQLFKTTLSYFAKPIRYTSDPNEEVQKDIDSIRKHIQTLDRVKDEYRTEHGLELSQLIDDSIERFESFRRSNLLDEKKAIEFEMTFRGFHLHKQEFNSGLIPIPHLHVRVAPVSMISIVNAVFMPALFLLSISWTWNSEPRYPNFFSSKYTIGSDGARIDLV